MMTQTLLMGDPTYFQIVGGANPFTRTWWGRKKQVNIKKAIQQWQHLKEFLESFGMKVLVIPPDPQHPGLVYPANAGVRIGSKFILSNLLPTRAGETPIYRKLLKQFGLTLEAIQSRFEGEADFFPVDEKWIFTYGTVLQQKFVPQFSLPPWRRVYGFRSEKKALEELKTRLPAKTKIIDFELIEESHYHGDTIFCSFGERREYLMAYLEGLAPESRERCRRIFGEKLISMSSRDAFYFAANSFQVKTHEGLKLIMPQGVSVELQEEVRRRGVEPALVDVTEFLKKGGGAVKCMIGDLGDL